MEGLSNPDKLEALWERSKAKKLWDDSQNRPLDQHLSQTRPTEDSVSVKEYMGRRCNMVQTPNSPTPQENHRVPHIPSLEKWDNLDKYDKFINELSVRIEGGWPPAAKSHMMKTYCDILSDSLPEPKKTKKPTRFRTSKETDSQHNSIRTRRPNPRRSRLP